VATELRAALIRDLGARSGQGRHIVRAADVTGSSAGPTGSLGARLRGSLLIELLRFWTVGYTPVDFFEDPLAAWRSDDHSAELEGYVAGLTGDNRAELATEVTAHAVVLFERLGLRHPASLARTGVAASVRLLSTLQLSDRYDLVVGTAVPQASSIALLDVTTSSLSERTDDVLAYHALTWTLRTGLAPSRVVALSTLTGDTRTHEVTPDVLQVGARAVLRAVQAGPT
jgi:hypothetical protein